MHRRTFLAAAAVTLARPTHAAEEPFDAQTVPRLARALSEAAYRKPDAPLPTPFNDLSYDAYRQIRFDPRQALWRGLGLSFEAQFFHRGSIFADRVDLWEVAGGRATAIPYDASAFGFGPTAPPTTDLGWAGFRLHTPLNRPDVMDEVAVFLGATYFRAVARGQGYGLSARAFGLNTADPGGEEFPAFRAFWLERPEPGATSITVTGLLDSPSVAGSARITVRPGDTTIMDVALTLYPRVDLPQAGLGGMASMFLFDSTNRASADDYRRAVHDSNGLQIHNGRGEQLWRALANPRTLQVSTFQDASPRGYGLLQRPRTLDAFEDLEARYEARPGLWVEPVGDWGEGAVQLVEIPTKQEIHDNIVAQWRPKQPLAAKEEHRFTCRLHWTAAAPGLPPLARWTRSRSGAAPDGRLFVLDAGPAPGPLRALVTASAGKVANVTVQPASDGSRLAFELLPGGAPTVELRAQLLAGDTPASEAWLYRWTA